MSKTLEERKAELEKTLIEDYAEKPRKWHQGTSRYNYRTTNSLAQENWLGENVYFPIIIKNEFKEYRVVLALVFIITVFFFFGALNSKESSNVLFSILPLLLFFYLVKCALKKETYITINEEGILIETENIGIIKWENIITSYIFNEKLSESEINRLQIFHYDLVTDTFLKTEYELKYYGFNIPDLCFYIEYWRIKTKNELNKTKEQPN